MIQSYDKTFFTFDMIEKTFKQIKLLQKDVFYTIYITLSNNLGKKATYSIDAHFKRNDTNDLIFYFKPK